MLRLCLVIVFCTALLFCACKKDGNIPQPGLYTPVSRLLTKGAGIATPVTGKWQWLKSYHTNTGTITPGITNYSERIEFGTDSIMTIYRNDTYYYQFTYLYMSDYRYGGRSFPVTMVNGFTYQTVIKNDTLNLSTFDLVDQNQLTYVKIK